ncbi:MAG: biotin/lipoyl-binding protein [Candidatus Obscuribacter sp.]|nr:biotin/lipoyl-binding protein [Candidatus Obscuribacter sp.]
MKYQTFIDLAKHSTLVVLMACATISLSGCDKPESHGAEMPPAMPVVVAPLTSAMVKDAETFVGTLKARKTVVIRPRVEGYITAINVVSGESVGKGAALVEIDTAKQKEALASRLATRESMVDEKLSADENLHALLANRQAKVATLNYQQSQYQRYKGT